MSCSSSRRTLLKLCGTGLAEALLGCGSESGAPAAFGDVSAGNSAELAVGALQQAGSAPVFIARDEQGLYALTITCTHQGCDVAPQDSAGSPILVCPCHGSRFDRNGAVLRGPAGSALVHFQVTVDASGAITIHGGTQVDASVRAAV